jgi:hypothetical protein
MALGENEGNIKKPRRAIVTIENIAFKYLLSFFLQSLQSHFSIACCINVLWNDLLVASYQATFVLIVHQMQSSATEQHDRRYHARALSLLMLGFREN